MTMYARTPSDGDIAVALAGRIPPAGILLLQAVAAGLRAKKRHTHRWYMARAGIRHSWYYELRRLLIRSGFLDEDGRIYLPDAETVQRQLAARAMELRAAALKRVRRIMQPLRSTLQRTGINTLSTYKDVMVEKYGPAILLLPDRE